MQNKVKKNSFIGGIAVLMFSQGLIKILGLIYTLYLVNREGFGDSGNAIYASGYQIYAMLLTLSSIGVPNAISKLISEKVAVGNFKEAHRIFKISLATFLIIGLTGTLILCLGATYISNNLLQIPEAKITLITLSPAIFFVAIASVFKGYFNGMEIMKVTAKSQIIEQCCKTFFTIGIVEIIASLSKNSTKCMAAGATIATSLATIFGFLYLLYYYYLCRKNFGNIIKNSVYVPKERVLKIIKNILKVSIPISLSAIMASLTKNIDSVTVVRFLKNYMSISDAKLQYGILSGKIETLVALPLSLNIAFSTALVPAISSAKAKGNTQEISKKISFSILIGMLIGLPCTFGMNIFAKEILDLLFPNANQGIEILKISSISIIFAIISQTISGALQGMGKEFKPAKAYGIGIIIKIISNIILLKNQNLGAKGAAIGTVLCNFTAFIILYYELIKNTNIKLNINKCIIKPIFATIIMSVTSFKLFLILKEYLIQKIALIIIITFAVIIYILSIIIFRIISLKDLKQLASKKII